MLAWIMFAVLGTISLLTGSVFLVLFFKFSDDKRKKRPTKDTILAKLDLFNRKFLIEKMGIKDMKVVENVHPNKWSQLSKITDHFSRGVAKGFSEIINKLEKGSKHEKLEFEGASIYSSKRRAKYKMLFYRIEDHSDFLWIINFTEIPISKNKKEKTLINKIKKNEINKIPLKYKGFVAFNIKPNIQKNISRFLEIINIKKSFLKHIFYIENNSSLVFIVSKNKKKKVKNIMDKIIFETQKNKYSNELKYLFNASSIAISNKINSQKNLNDILITLSFLLSESLRTNKMFLFANKDIDREQFSTYNKALKIFDKAIKSKNLDTRVIPIRDIHNNRKIVNYVSPCINNINDNLFKGIVNDTINLKKMMNSFAEKKLSITSNSPILIDVNESWLIDNLDKIKNKKALLIIHFNKITDTQERIDIVERIIDKKIAFALISGRIDDGITSLMQSTKPRFILIDETIWSDNKLLPSDQYLKLIAFKGIALENKAKLIFKNPSLILDENTHTEIGLKYYFTT